MKNILNKFLASIFLFLVLGLNTSFGQDTAYYSIKNNTGVTLTDLEVPFSGGGALTAVVITNPPGCPTPAITYPGGNTVKLNWVTPCVTPGASATMQVTTTSGPLGYTNGSGFWTSYGSPTGPGLNEYFDIKEVPTLSEWGLIILALLLVTTSMVMIQKRQNALVIADAITQHTQASLFEGGLYFKSLGVVLLIAVIGLAVALLYYGTLSITDTFGTLTCACIVAYIVQLWLVMSKNEK